MKLTQLFLPCLLALGTITAQAKGDSHKQIQLEGTALSNDNAFFVSEIHGFYELNDFKFALIGQLQQSAHIKHVIIEAGHANAYLINRYMQGRDIGPIDPKAKPLLDEWKQLYAQLPLTVHGIDFERMEFVKATRLILNDNPGTEQTKLYTYINSLADTAKKIPSDVNGYETRTALYNQARAIFAEEKPTLRAIMKTDFEVLEGIMENPALEQKMGKRNKRMYTNMRQLNNEMKEGFVCILGGAHNMLHSRQSILSHYLHDHDRHVTLIKMLCKNCYISTYARTDMLRPFASDPDDHKSKTKELEESFDSYYKSDEYRIVSEKTISKEDTTQNEQVSIYYALFKDQPKW